MLTKLEQVELAKPKRVLEPVIITGCPVCNSQNIRRDGVRYNKSGDLQKYKCLDCGKFFSVNVGFEKMKHSPQAITTAMQLYYQGARRVTNTPTFTGCPTITISNKRIPSFSI